MAPAGVVPPGVEGTVVRLLRRARTPGRAGRAVLALTLVLLGATVGGIPAGAAAGLAPSLAHPGAVSACALLPSVDPYEANASNASTYPIGPPFGPGSPPNGTTNGSNGSSLRPTFNITVGQVRTAWATICGEPSFVRLAAQEMLPENFTEQFGWNGSADTISFAVGFLDIAPCDTNLSFGNGSGRSYLGDPCEFATVWGATFATNGTDAIHGPDTFEYLATTNAGGPPLGAPGIGNGSTSPLASGGNGAAPLIGWILGGFLVAALAILSGVGMASRRSSGASRLPADPARPAAPPIAVRPDGAPGDPPPSRLPPRPPDPLSDLF